MFDRDKNVIAIIGLGYVGLPLAISFSKKLKVIGFDINNYRINELRAEIDSTDEVDFESLKSSNVLFTNKNNDIRQANIFIVTVPTPINDANDPDLSALMSATKTVGQALKKDDLVIFESTVYPGTTSQICVPILEKESNLDLNNDFFVGYSPERINPGDKSNKLEEIVKVTSGSNDYSSKFVDNLYSEIISAGTFKASSIEVAEAAKIIENTQRDINIALMNECSQLLSKLNIPMKEVLEAANTKWNFLNFHPGLVGGHCIGVDPYYLAYLAKLNKLDSKMILSGRSTNDFMGEYIFKSFLKEYIQKNLAILTKKILVLGITFKKDCPDARNSKVIELVAMLDDYGFEIECVDPYSSQIDIDKKIFSKISKQFNSGNSGYAAIFYAVDHNAFSDISVEILRENLVKNGLIYDLTHRFETDDVNWQI
jgi:UDP-N-acetyl-D-glucosamine/UDP-N-acetyl-D-galactosamine dehydrogenase